MIADVENIALFGQNYVDALEGVCVELVSTFGYFCEEDVAKNKCDDVVRRLIYQFKTKEKVVNLICESLEEKRNLDLIFSALNVNRLLIASTGYQLDGLGSIIGYTRQDLTDNEYLEKIRLQIQINKSNGEPEIILKVLKDLTESTYTEIQEIFPSSVWTYFNGSVIDDNLYQVIKSLLPSGVNLELVSSLGITEEDTFSFLPDDGIDDLNGKGFAEYLVGGGSLSEKVL